MVVPEEGAFPLQTQDARGALARKVRALRREHDHEAEEQEHFAGQGDHTLVMGPGSEIYDATGGPAISFGPGPLDRPGPERVRRALGRWNLKRDE